MKCRNELLNRSMVALSASALLVGMVLVGGQAEARPGDRHGPKSEAEREAAHEKIRKIWAKTLRKRVGLSEAVARKVEKTQERFSQERRSLRRGMGQSKRALRMLLKSGSEDEKAFSLAVQRLLDGRRALEQLRRRQFEAMRQHLTSKEQAKLLMAMHRMRRRIHKNMRRHQRKRMEKRAREILQDEDTPLR
mgnify:CR=1 FL=1